MCVGCVSCCLMMSHGKYADGTDRRTDGRTPDRYITISARRGQRNEPNYYYHIGPKRGCSNQKYPVLTFNNYR